jgi:dTDP-4-dehydrorhamnose reductase
MRVLILGGKGRLGRALGEAFRETFCSVRCAGREEIDIATHFSRPNPLPDIIVNCAAILSIPSHMDFAYARNVNGYGAGYAAEVAKSIGSRFVHISTEYVFGGMHGMYAERDFCAPVNKYGVSKANGDELVEESGGRHLILRVPFYYDGGWPYPMAFTDQWTSRRAMRDVVPDIVEAALDPALTGILHIGGPRRCVFDVARELRPDVQPGMRADWGMFSLPRDVSLDSGKWEEYKRGKAEKRAVAK